MFATFSALNFYWAARLGWSIRMISQNNINNNAFITYWDSVNRCKNRHQFPNISSSPTEWHQARVRWISIDGGEILSPKSSEQKTPTIGLRVGPGRREGGERARSGKNWVRVDKSIFIKIPQKEASEWGYWAWNADMFMSLDGPEVLSPFLTATPFRKL